MCSGNPSVADSEMDSRRIRRPNEREGVRHRDVAPPWLNCSTAYGDYRQPPGRSFESARSRRPGAGRGCPQGCPAGPTGRFRFRQSAAKEPLRSLSVRRSAQDPAICAIAVSCGGPSPFLIAELRLADCLYGSRPLGCRPTASTLTALWKGHRAPFAGRWPVEASESTAEPRTCRDVGAAVAGTELRRGQNPRTNRVLVGSVRIVTAAPSKLASCQRLRPIREGPERRRQ